MLKQILRIAVCKSNGSIEDNDVRALNLLDKVLTHTLTHTTISASGQARMYWTYDLRVIPKTAVKTVKSRCAATEN